MSCFLLFVLYLDCILPLYLLLYFFLYVTNRTTAKLIMSWLNLALLNWIALLFLVSDWLYFDYMSHVFKGQLKTTVVLLFNLVIFNKRSMKKTDRWRKYQLQLVFVLPLHALEIRLVLTVLSSESQFFNIAEVFPTYTTRWDQGRYITDWHDWRKPSTVYQTNTS